VTGVLRSYRGPQGGLYPARRRPTTGCPTRTWAQVRKYYDDDPDRRAGLSGRPLINAANRIKRDRAQTRRVSYEPGMFASMSKLIGRRIPFRPNTIRAGAGQVSLASMPKAVQDQHLTARISVVRPRAPDAGQDGCRSKAWCETASRIVFEARRIAVAPRLGPSCDWLVRTHTVPLQRRTARAESRRVAGNP